MTTNGTKYPNKAIIRSSIFDIILESFLVGACKLNFLFKKIGLLMYPNVVATEEQMFESALEVGASDCATYDECHEIICEPEDFGAVRDGLEAKYGSADSSQLTWKPLALTTLDEETKEKIQKLIDALEDSDDVQTVISNGEF